MKTKPNKTTTIMIMIDFLFNQMTLVNWLFVFIVLCLQYPPLAESTYGDGHGVSFRHFHSFPFSLFCSSVSFDISLKYSHVLCLYP